MIGFTLVERAARIAAEAHKEQVRKSDGSPYIVHPFMCAMMLQKHGAQEEVIAAALVHDVLEDTVYTAEQLRDALGEEVLAIVQRVSEDKSLPWEERKQAYATTIAESEASLLVSLADKIHNLSNILAGLREEGPVFWEHFNRGRTEQEWFVKLMVGTYTQHLSHPLVEKYQRLAEELQQL